MIIDLETSAPGPDGSHFDVCVIGAGAAGLVLALELIRQGKRVLVLEGGGSEGSNKLRRWERRTQALNKSEIVGLPYAGAHSGRFRALGGSTTAWAGQIVELDDIDFAPRPWVPGSGWPFRKSELAASYARAIEYEGLDESLLDDDAVWSESGLEPANLGDDLTFAFSRYCPEKKFARLFKKTIDTHPNLLVCLHANACNLIMAEDGETVTSVRCRTLTGKETHFSAGRFVLCLGGIESSRFLLQPYAAGVAPWNRSGLVGRHFQDHIHYFAGDIVDAKLDDKNWHYGPHRVVLHNYEYLPKIKLSPAAQERYGVLNVSGMAEYDDGIYPTLRVATLLIAGPASAVTFRGLAYMVPRAPAVLWNYAQTRINPDFVLPWAKLKLAVYCEQSPLSESRITLSDRRDALGLFQTRMDWRVSKQEIETVRRYVQVAQQAFAQRGLRIEPDPDLFKDGLERKFTDRFHHMGGTRMATSASEGVVDVNLRLHGTRNAYVCSSSVFPSSGFANPTHTLLALAVRLAWHLKDLPRIRQNAG